jgi:hypothetical protein
MVGLLTVEVGRWRSPRSALRDELLPTAINRRLDPRTSMLNHVAAAAEGMRCG